MQQLNFQDQVKTYRQFASSYYVYEGIRITIAILLPLLIFNKLNLLQQGIAIALGAMCVSIVDLPGPIHHRKNAMVATIILLFFVTIITDVSAAYPLLLSLLIVVFGFIFSMIAVHGVRTSFIGVAALLIMVLNIENHLNSKELFIHAALIAAGGCWYFLLSLLLHRLRPYKLVQQAIGDCIISTAKYLRIKASMYSTANNFDKSYAALLEEQVEVHNKQSLVRELLFKTRSIVKDSTHTGRVLLMIFLDSVDLFERIMSSQRDYKILHAAFGDDDLLQQFQQNILLLATELDNIGEALQEGTKSVTTETVTQSLTNLEAYFNNYRKQHLNEKNIQAFISLKHILDGLLDMHNRITLLHRYTSFDRKIKAQHNNTIDYSQFVTPTNFKLNLLKTNLTIQSNTFRHAIRVGVGLLAGYLLSKALPVNHGYWIVLTILVILKPAYSITKKRNFERLAGTFIGAAIGASVLYFIKDTTALVIIMAVMMIGTYSLLRVQYLFAVMLMTIYLLIAFYLLKPEGFNNVISDRVIDTVIGSILAAVVTFIIPPKWEHEQINDMLQAAVKANSAYYKYIAEAFIGKEFNTQTYKMVRKESFVAMANLSESFQRMLFEPKSKQKNKVDWYQLVVNNHLLTSHIATLSSYITKYAATYGTPDFKPIIKITYKNLIHTNNMLSKKIDMGRETSAITNESSFIFRERQQHLQKKRMTEIKSGSLETNTRKELSIISTITDQFEYIYKISIEMKKTVSQFISN